LKTYNIAVVGATGMVGRQMLKSLEEQHVPINNLYVFASEKSKGQIVYVNKTPYTVEVLTETSFDKDIDYALFSAGASISLKYGNIAASKGITVIDNSSAFRQDESIPLITAEVNFSDIKNYDKIIANPNCTTIQSVIPLKIIDDLFTIKRIIYSTYQAVSGSGVKGVEDLKNGFDGKEHAFYQKQIAHNVIPFIDTLSENSYTKEEIKMMYETRKILNKPNLLVTATCVRVPVYNGHSVSINVECENEVDVNTLIKHFHRSPAIQVFEADDMPTPIDVDGQDLVYVGRIRKDHSLKHGLNLFVVGDNIRIGAASNAVSILKKLLEVRP
jgi:aspartate-semialdehyde dehydrogenase